MQVGIENSWPIPEDAVASPATAGLLSDVSLDIKHGESSQFLEPGVGDIGFVMGFRGLARALVESVDVTQA